MSSSTSDIKIRIVVVDDEPDILLTLSAVLSSRGHYVKTFDNPAEALSHLTSTDNGPTPYYDLVITDYRMPGSISGLDLAKRIKEHSITIKMKLFLMSGSFNVSSSLPQECSEALRAEILDGFIQKPVSNDKLIAVIERRFSHDNNNKNKNNKHQPYTSE